MPNAALPDSVYKTGGRLITYQIRTDEPRIARNAGEIEYEICPWRQHAFDVPSFGGVGASRYLVSLTQSHRDIAADSRQRGRSRERH
jgi:hypothetical protein